MVDSQDFEGQMGDIVDLSKLGWEEAKGVYWPAIRIDHPSMDVKLILEGRIQQRRHNIKHPLYVRYIGVGHHLARKYDYISAAKWVPLDNDDDDGKTEQPQASDAQRPVDAIVVRERNVEGVQFRDESFRVIVGCAV